MPDLAAPFGPGRRPPFSHAFGSRKGLRPERLTALLLLVALAGCQNSTAENTETAVPKTVAFTGTPDKALVGTWGTADGNSTYHLREDGSATLDMKVKTQNSSFDTKSNGKWSVDKGRFLYQDEQGNVVPYLLTAKPNEITLTSLGSAKRELKLTRKSK